MEPPDFSYGLVIQGGDITFLPGLESWLNGFIKNAVLQPYILPDGVLVPLAPGCGREVCFWTLVAFHVERYVEGWCLRDAAQTAARHLQCFPFVAVPKQAHRPLSCLQRSMDV